MSKSALCVSILLLAVPALSAKEKAPIQTIVTNATYVMVTTYDGDVLSPDVLQDDRKAVQNVQGALEQWGRYKLVYKPEEADLILVVRTGRAVEAQGGYQVGTSQVGISTDRPRGHAYSVAGENGDPLDSLAVFVASQGIGGVPVWRSRAAGGLKAPELKLLKEFRAKVEAAAKKP